MITLKELNKILPFEIKIKNGEKEKNVVVYSVGAKFLTYTIIKGVPNKKFIYFYDKKGVGILYENHLIEIDGRGDLNNMRSYRHSGATIEITKTNLPKIKKIKC
jgi:hypothetical protein